MEKGYKRRSSSRNLYGEFYAAKQTTTKKEEVDQKQIIFSVYWSNTGFLNQWPDRTHWRAGMEAWNGPVPPLLVTTGPFQSCRSLEGNLFLIISNSYKKKKVNTTLINCRVFLSFFKISPSRSQNEMPALHTLTVISCFLIGQQTKVIPHNNESKSFSWKSVWTKVRMPGCRVLVHNTGQLQR